MANKYSLEYTRRIMVKVVDLLAQDGCSLSRLARQLGLDRSTVHRYKNGERAMSVYRLKEIAEILGVSVASLLPDQDNLEGGAYGQTEYNETCCRDCAGGNDGPDIPERMRGE